MPQTWNDILGAVKRKLGANLNLLELSDEEIIEGLESDVVPYISQFAPHKNYSILDYTNRIPHRDGRTQWAYEVRSDGNYIIDIYEIYANATSRNAYYDDPFEGTKYAGGNVMGATSAYGAGSMDIYGGAMIQMAINNTFLDAAAVFMPKNTWEFIPPDTLLFDYRIIKAVVVYNTVHTKLETMQPDIYHTMFKPYCIASVLEWVVAIRTKYENVSTPFGQINLNWQKLEQDSQQIKQDIEQKLQMLPLDRFIEIV